MPAPTAAFTYTPESGPAALTVVFTDTSTGSPTSWIWDFGDGTFLTTDPRASAYVFYEMDEAGSATAAVDATGNGHTGAYSGITSPTPGVTGRFNNGYAFTNGYIQGPIIPPTSASWAAAGWINTTATTLQVVLCRWGGSFPGTNFPWTAGLNTDGTPFFQLYTNTGATAANISHVSSAINDGAWHHLCAMKSGTTVSLWVDGVQVGSTTVASDPFGAGIAFSVGSVAAAMDQFNGSMDDAGFWNNALLPEQIWTLAHFPPATAAENPTHVYTQAGTFTASLTAVNGSGASSPVTAPVTVYGHIPMGWDTNWANAINTDGSGKATAILSNLNRTIALSLLTSVANVVAFGGMAIGKRYVEFNIVSVGASGQTGIGCRPVAGWDLRDYTQPFYSTTPTTGLWVYRSDGQIQLPTGIVAYGASYGPGDVIGMAVEMGTALTVTTLTFYKNGVSQGAVTLSFAGATPGLVALVAQTGTFTAETIEVTINGGDYLTTPLAHAPPATYNIWGSICGWDYTTLFGSPTQPPTSDYSVGLTNPGGGFVLNGAWGRKTGKYYFEVNQTDAYSGASYIGIVGIVDGVRPGVFDPSDNSNIYGIWVHNFSGPGTWSEYIEGGTFGINVQISTDTSTPAANGSAMGIAVDMDNGVIYFYIDGVVVKQADGVTPAVHAIYAGAGTPVYPFCSPQGVAVVTAVANFAGPFHGGGYGPTLLGKQFLPWASADVSPSAAFTASISEMIQGTSVAFTDTSTGGPSSWVWDFGDGNTSTAQNPTHTYAVGGIYTVTLVASNSVGASAPATATMQVASWADALVPLCFSQDYVNFINSEVVNSATLSYEWLTLGLTIPSGTAHGSRVGTNMGRRSGSWFVEFTINSLAGVISVGLGTSTAYNLPHGGQSPPGVDHEANYSVADGGSTTTPDITYRSDGSAGWQSSGDSEHFAAYGASWGAGDVIGLAVDFDTLLVTFYKNGVSQGALTVAGFVMWTTDSQGYTPVVTSAIGHANTGSSVSVRINGGNSGFTFTRPGGYLAWRDLCEIDQAWTLFSSSAGSYDPSTETWATGSDTRGAVATFGRWAGQYYFEVVMNGASATAGNYIGITDQHRYTATNSGAPYNLLYVASYGGVLIGGHGGFYYGDFTVLNDMGPSSAAPLGDRLGFGVDFDNGNLYVFINGVQIYTVGWDPTEAIGWYPLFMTGGTGYTAVPNFVPGTIPTALDSTTFKAWGAFGSPPTADFTWTPNTGFAPLVVNFTDTSTGAPTSWSWDFGDSGTSTLQNPSHTYASGGVYTVTLTATNANGASSPDPQTLTVETLLPPVVPTQSTAGAIGAPFEYQIRATNDPTSYGAPGLPSGLSVNASTGLITGTPTGPAISTSLTASASNAAGTGHGPLTILILAGLPAVRSDALTVMQGQPFVYDIVATLDPIAYDATPLPAGLVVDHIRGVISGTPSVAGSTVVRLSASNLAGSGFGTLTLQVAPALIPGLNTQKSPGVYDEAPTPLTDRP